MIIKWQNDKNSLMVSNRNPLALLFEIMRLFDMKMLSAPNDPYRNNSVRNTAAHAASETTKRLFPL